MKPKKLFVGEPRICKQVAYVVDCASYDLADKVDDVARCRDYEEVVVCAFKRKSKKLIRVKDKSITNVIYLDDVCKRIDNGYYDAVKQELAELLEEPQIAGNKEESVSIVTNKENEVTNLSNDCELENISEANVNNESPIKHESFFHKLWRHLLHPLQTLKKIYRKLRYYVWNEIKWWFVRSRQEIKERRLLKKLRSIHRKIVRQQKNPTGKNVRKEINLINAVCAIPHQMFLYVLYSEPNAHLFCTHIEERFEITSNGYAISCCSAIPAFGSLVDNKSLNMVYHRTYARIIKLSSLNGSYCLCNFSGFCTAYQTKEKILEKGYQTATCPKDLWISFDKTCNLACKSCRRNIDLPDKVQQENLQNLSDQLLHSGWLEQANEITIAGMGEVFYSPYYRHLLNTNVQRQQIHIFTNGTLFNESNWQLIKDKYKNISVSVSIDAATPATYQKLRGGNWQVLMQNLAMLSKLRQSNQIKFLQITFVVQRDNYREMVDFVAFGQKIGVDSIMFRKLHNALGAYDSQVYLENCLIIKNNYLDKELFKVFSHPIFKNPMVDLDDFQFLINNSIKKYQ